MAPPAIPALYRTQVIQHQLTRYQSAEEADVNGPSGTRSRQTTGDWLSAKIKELIHEEALQPGDQLPTENEVSIRYGVSRTSVREAFQVLENEGLVSVVHGRGRFITAAGNLRVERPVTKYESTTQMLERMGYRVTAAVLSVTCETATSTESQALGLAPGTEVIRLIRLRYGDGAPLVFSLNTIPRHLVSGPPEHRDWSGSLAQFLEGQGHRVVTSVARISALNMPDEYSQRHDLKQYDPWLLVEETCITSLGERVVYANEYHRAGKFAFNVVRRR